MNEMIPIYQQGSVREALPTQYIVLRETRESRIARRAMAFISLGSCFIITGIFSVIGGVIGITSGDDDFGDVGSFLTGAGGASLLVGTLITTVGCIIRGPR